MNCPVPRCKHSAPRGKLMCAPHWRRVPKALQQAVWSTWGAVCGDLNNGDKAEAYEHARTAAIEAVTEPIQGKVGGKRGRRTYKAGDPTTTGGP